jgi:hypothetical protein
VHCGVSVETKVESLFLEGAGACHVLSVPGGEMERMKPGLGNRL